MPILKMRMRAAALLLVAIASSPGAAETRAYTTVVPKSAATTAGKLPLIVVLHCYGCDGPEDVVDLLHLDEVSNRHGVMLLLPDGRVDRRKQRFWSATEACCNFDGAPDDDVAFIRGLIDEAIAKRRADPARIYLAGYSNGGFFAHRLACELSSRIAGIVSVAGAGVFDDARCRTSAPVAVVEVHGDADVIVPYGGGTLGGRLPVTGKLPSAHATVAAWARRNGCSGELVSGGADADLDNNLAGAETRIERYRGCKRPVELWTVRGAGHGAQFSSAFGERLWSFLSAPPSPPTSTPAANSPAANSPAANSPAANSPAANSPAANSPAASSPAASSPAADAKTKR